MVEPSRSQSSSRSSSLLPTKSSILPPGPRPSTLSSKFGRFVGNVLSSPSSSSTSTAPSVIAASSDAPRASVDRANRRERGWVDLVPSSPRDQTRNPFLVNTSEPSTSASSSSRLQQPSSSTQEPSPTAVDVPPSAFNHSLLLSSSLPPSPPLQVASSSQTSTTPAPPLRRFSSSAETGDQQVVVSASSPSLRSTWTRKNRPRANTASSATSVSTPKWSWTGSLGVTLREGFGATPSSKAKWREAIDSGWGEPDEMVQQLDGSEGAVEDEGFWDGVQGEQGFDLISSLPTEIALHIFLFLPRPSLASCARVSRNWGDLAADSSIWRTYFLSNPSWHLRPSYLRSLVPPPSPPSQFAALSLLSPLITPTPPRRPAPPSRTPSSLSRIKSLAAPDAYSEDEGRIGPSGVHWKKVCEKRVWLDRRWGDEAVSREMRLEGHDDSVYCLQFDQTKLVTGSRDQNIRVWDLATGACLQEVHAHDASVLCLMFDEETGFMVSGGSDAKIIVWDLGGPGISSKPLTKKHILGGHKQGVLDIAINDEYIVSCSKDTTLLIHSRSTLEHLHTLTGHSGPVNAIGIHGGRIASASGDGKIKIWDLVSGECLRTMEGHERGLACIDFKGDLIVSGSNDRSMKVWSATTGECLKTLTGHTDLVRTLAMDPESGRIVSGGYDKQILIWSLFTGEIVQTLKSSHTSLVFDIKFDSGKIVSASHDRLVIVHDFGDEESGRMFF